MQTTHKSSMNRQVHARCIGAQLYERGYAGDAAAVAGGALKQAATSDIDVVMIDTAGRMQDNEPLMRSLAKLVFLKII